MHLPNAKNEYKILIIFIVFDQNIYSILLLFLESKLRVSRWSNVLKKNKQKRNIRFYLFK